jgi:hypothetical protein
MKTGTTYLQQLLVANRDQLSADGFLFPGGRWIEQVRAAQDAVAVGRRDPRIRAQAAGAWNRMVHRMHEYEGAAVVFSMEFLSFANPQQAARVTRSLAPSPVHAVITVRDSAAIVPSQWQTSVRGGSTLSWPDYMSGVRDAELQAPSSGRHGRRNPALRSFLRAQDIPRILSVWAPLVGAGRLHVVTVPASSADPDLLWRRFATAVGMPHELARAAPRRTNQSLGFASTEFLRQVNAALGKRRPSDYNRVVKDYLAAEVLTRLSTEETAARLDEQTLHFAHRWNARVAAAIDGSRATVLGDLSDLPTSGSLERSVPPQRPPDADVLRAASLARAEMDRLIRRLSRRLATRPGPDILGFAGAAAAGTAGGEGDPPSVAVAVSEVARLIDEAIRLRRRLNEARKASR